MKIKDILKDVPGIDKIRLNTAVADIIAFLEQDIGLPVPEPSEITFVQIDKVVPKKKTKEAQEAIDAIKKAHKEKRAEKVASEAGKKPEPNKASKQRRLITDEERKEIVKLRDKEKMTFTDIAKKIGCSDQTAINNYNKAKEGKK